MQKNVYIIIFAKNMRRHTIWLNYLLTYKTENLACKLPWLVCRSVGGVTIGAESEVTAMPGVTLKYCFYGFIGYVWLMKHSFSLFSLLVCPLTCVLCHSWKDWEIFNDSVTLCACGVIMKCLCRCFKFHVIFFLKGTVCNCWEHAPKT